MSELPVRIYTPEPILGHPLRLLREMAADLWNGRELAWRLFVRDTRGQYRQTLLGYVWAFLPPLAASMTFIFLNSQGIIHISGTAIPYPAFAMIGTLLWQVFVDALQSPSGAIALAQPMLTKINFPREAIILSGLYKVIFNFLIRLILLVAVMFWWGIVPGPGILFFIPAVLGLITCGTALGMILIPLGSLYGDVGRSIPMGVQFWMLLTPVLYPPRTEGLAGLLTKWNPASPLITLARDSLTNQPLTTLPSFVLVLGISLIVFFIGWIAYRISMPHLIARMGG
jgi:lipopolysaccharide transport system permease protein